MTISSHVTQKIIFPLWMWKDKKRNVIPYYKELVQSQTLPVKTLQELQWKRMHAILNYAYQHVPFYRAWFTDSGLTPEDIRTHTDLLKLPLLSKSDIQENVDILISDEFQKEQLLKDKTGGSTGSPLVFFYTKDKLELRDAATYRHDSWAYSNIGDRVALLWGAVPDLTPYQTKKATLRNFLLEKKLILDASSLTKEKMIAFVDKLNHFKPRVILAYANTMKLFAEFIRENKLSVYSPRSIICSSEVLMPEARKLIENVFRTEVFNRYGCREFSVIASECEIHNGMHINAENLYLEFVKDGRHVATGEMGEIIITDMTNFGMPLIRYNIKDVGTHLEGLCPCGRTLPLMEIGEGRSTDFLTTPQGTYVSGIAVCTFVITNIPGIKQIQIIQDEPDHLLVKLAKGEGFCEETLIALNKNIDKFLSSEIRRDYEYVDEIPNEKSGKYRFCISEIIE